MLITPPEPISDPRSKSRQHSHLPSGAEDPTITPLHNSPTPKPAPRGDAGHPRANFASRGQPRDAGSREGGERGPSGRRHRRQRSPTEDPTARPHSPDPTHMPRCSRGSSAPRARGASAQQRLRERQREAGPAPMAEGGREGRGGWKEAEHGSAAPSAAAPSPPNHLKRLPSTPLAGRPRPGPQPAPGGAPSEAVGGRGASEPPRRLRGASGPLSGPPGLGAPGPAPPAPPHLWGRSALPPSPPPRGFSPLAPTGAGGDEEGVVLGGEAGSYVRSWFWGGYRLLGDG